MKIIIIDYKLNNLFSVKHACEVIGADVSISSTPGDILEADAVILPGVGAFKNAMVNIKKLHLEETIKEFIKSGKPFLGICLGMQLLFSNSEEFGSHNGLNIIKGSVKKIPKEMGEGVRVKVPYIGWNTIYSNKVSKNVWSNSALKNISENEFMYFIHSYYVQPSDKNVVLSLTRYRDLEYCSGIKKDNITAFQFHPEKSGKEGIKIYKDWLS